mmetsp:Transcript_17798/g.56930  ORF Transcript_17798/g.56930 Transcript_17798/m.56930 type:complete len:766 (+) Transcript_17798:834-3131(+)
MALVAPREAVEEHQGRGGLRGVCRREDAAVPLLARQLQDLGFVVHGGGPRGRSRRLLERGGRGGERDGRPRQRPRRHEVVDGLAGRLQPAPQQLGVSGLAPAALVEGPAERPEAAAQLPQHGVLGRQQHGPRRQRHLAGALRRLAPLAELGRRGAAARREGGRRRDAGQQAAGRRRGRPTAQQGPGGRAGEGRGLRHGPCFRGHDEAPRRGLAGRGGASSRGREPLQRAGDAREGALGGPHGRSLGGRRRLHGGKDVDGQRAGRLPVDAHLVVGAAAEELAPQRVHAEREDPLLRDLLAADHRAVGDLFRRGKHPHVLRHHGGAGPLEQAHAPLQVAGHLVDSDPVDGHAVLGRKAHRPDHGLPDRSLAQPGDGPGRQAVADDVAAGASADAPRKPHEPVKHGVGHFVGRLPVDAGALGLAVDGALIHLQAQRVADHEHALRAAWLVKILVSAECDFAVLLIYGHTLMEDLARCLQSHDALDEALVLHDLARARLHVQDLPRPLDGVLDGHHQRVLRALPDRVGADAIADGARMDAVHAPGLPHVGVARLQHRGLRHAPVHPEAVGGAALEELQLERVASQGDHTLDALPVFPVFPQLAERELVPALVRADELRVGLAIHAEAAAHEARTVLHPDVRAVEKAPGLAGAHDHRAPHGVVRGAPDLLGQEAQADGPRLVRLELGHLGPQGLDEVLHGLDRRLPVRPAAVGRVALVELEPHRALLDGDDTLMVGLALADAIDDAKDHLMAALVGVNVLGDAPPGARYG